MYGMHSSFPRPDKTFKEFFALVEIGLVMLLGLSRLLHLLINYISGENKSGAVSDNNLGTNDPSTH